jgi:hypothetical protein
MARKVITVHYRRLSDATSAFGHQTLEAALRKAMNHPMDGGRVSEHWKRRSWLVPPAAEDTLLMNLHHDGGTFFFGDLTQYTKGFMQTLIEEKEDTPILSVEQQPAPTGKEYVHSMMYWLVVKSHAFIIQSKSLTTKNLEEYFTWLLKDRTTVINATGQVILQFKFDADEVGGDLDDVSKIVIGSGAPIAAEAMTPAAGDTKITEVETYKEIGTKKPWRERAVEVLRAVMNNEADVQKLLTSVPAEAKLEVAVHIGYKTKKPRVSRAPMQEALRNLPEGEIRAYGRQGQMSGTDIRLSHKVNILTHGSLLDPTDVMRALRETYAHLVSN